MSVGRYGRRGRQWKPASYGRGHVSAGDPEAEQYATDMANRAAAVAVTLGFCPVCGGDIDEANGRKHHPECVVPDERKCFHEWTAGIVPGIEPARVTVCTKCGRRKT